MRRLALVALVLALAGEASAQMQHTTQRGGGAFAHPQPPAGNQTATLYSPKATGGEWYGAPVPTFDCKGDGYAGGSLDCGAGYTFTKSGTPTPAVPTPFHPGGWQGPATVGQVGVFGAGTYLKLDPSGNGNDPGDIAGDFSVCVALNSLASAGSVFPISNGGDTSANVGWSILRASASHAFTFYLGTRAIGLLNASNAGQIDLLCAGRDGSSAVGKANLGAINSAAVNGGWAPATAEQLRVGLGPAAAAFPYDAPILEIWISSAKPTDAALTALQAKAFSRARGPFFDDDASTVSHCYVSGGAWTCPVGPAWMAVGAPTYTTAPLAWAGFHDPDASQAIGLNGSSDWLAGPSSGGPNAESFTVCSNYKVNGATVGGFSPIAAKDLLGGNRTWAIGHVDANANLGFWVFKSAGGANTNLTIGAIGGSAVGAWHSMCAAYEYLGDGTSIMRGNLDGVATSIANALAVQETAATANIGYDGARYANAAIARVTYWKGWAANASQLDAMVRGAWGMTPQKGSAIFTRNGIYGCWHHASGGAVLHYVPAGVPCVNEGGLLANPADSNLIQYSEQIDNAVWGKTASGNPAPVVTANVAVAPDGSQTADRVVLTPVSGGFQALAAPTFGSSAGSTYNWALALRADAPGDTYIYCYQGGFYAVKRITVGTSWALYSTAPTAPGTGNLACYVGADRVTAGTTMAATTAGTIYAWGGKAGDGSEALGYIPTSASAPVSGPATAISGPNTGFTGQRWRIDVQGATANGWIGSGGTLWTLGGAANASPVDMVVWDVLAAPKYRTAYGFALSPASGTHVLRYSANALLAYPLTVCGDGVSIGGTLGAGTGIADAPTTWTISTWGGTMQSFAQRRSGGACP